MRYLSLLLLALAGCAVNGSMSSSFIATSPPRPPTDAQRVDILFGGHTTHAYVEHGLVRVFATSGNQYGYNPSYLDMLRELRRNAAASGCDAVLVRPLGVSYAHAYSASNLEGACLAYTDVR